MYNINILFQVTQMGSPCLLASIKDWSSSSWNLFDAFCMNTLFVAVGFILNIYTLNQVFYALNCLCWILRLLNIFYINPIQGPMVVLIGKMVCFKSILKLLYFFSLGGILLVNIKLIYENSGNIFNAQFTLNYNVFNLQSGQLNETD